MNKSLHINSQNIILKISIFLELLPIIFYLVFQKKIIDKSLWVIFFLLVVNFLADLIGLYSLTNDSTNFKVFNISILLEITFLYFFFQQVLHNEKIKKVITIALALFFVLWTYQFITYGQKTFIYSCAIVENFLILIFSISFYYESIKKAVPSYLFNEARFWVVTAYLIYSAGTFFLLMFLPNLHPEDLLFYYVLNYIFVIIRTILLSVAMFVKNDKLYS